MKHLEPARGCALQIASKQGLHTRKGARLTSHLKKLGDSLTCLPRLPEYSSLVVNKVNGMVPVNVTRIFCHSVACLGTDQCWNRKHMPRHVHECSAVLACKGAACDLVQASHSHTTLATRNLLGPAHCIQQWITHKERSTSHFTLEEVGWFSDMSASRLPEHSSLIVSTVNGKPTANVGSIFCHSVACLGTVQCCWDRNHMPGGFMNVSQYLLGKACRKIWFPASLSPYALATCTSMCHAGCIQETL